MRNAVLATLLALGLSAPAAAQNSPRPFWATQALAYGNCIVKADPKGSLRYVRAAAGTAAASAARSALAPVLIKCESALGAWAPHLREADRRNAVQAALQRTRNKQS
jgi:hypothetical protein